MVPENLKHYSIIKPLGKGGMGEVFLAEDTKLHRRVALKTLPADVAADPDRRARFDREARAVAALNHPSIVTIYSLEEADGTHFFTMELVEGKTLGEVIPAGGLPIDRTLAVAGAITDALSAAHEQGITHRDLKPGNIMATDDWRIKILDFGLARLRPSAAGPDSPTAAMESPTVEGSVLGTAPYMAPEQIKGREADHRSDIFSAGIIIFQLATGRHPFSGETTAEIMTSILRDPPRDPAMMRSELPVDLGRILRRCLEKDPRRRFQTALDLRNEIEDLKGENLRTSPTGGGPAGVRESRFVRGATLDEVRATGCRVVRAEGHTVALFSHGEKVFALDNRCPHMGFPLDRGSVKDCILTCHWHHARFDMQSGGTFDPWADDVRAFPVEIRNNEVWIDVARRDDPVAHHQQRVREGLEQNIPLVLAKASVLLLDRGVGPADPFRTALHFGAGFRRQGWGQGLTILTCMVNLLPHLEAGDRPRALYQGLSAVGEDCEGRPPRFGQKPLPGLSGDPARLKGWLRRFVEVRDEEGAERCIVSAVQAGATNRQLADMLFSAATDHRYIQTGHVLDFINKAFEALDVAGPEMAPAVLPSLAPGLAGAERMEESNQWRHPVDLIPILGRAFEAVPTALEIGQGRRGAWTGQASLLETVLGDDPQATVDSLMGALRKGATEEDVAGVVTHAAALRIARFHTSNEFSDWDTALHTFTFANSVHQGLRRAPSPDLVRGVFDAAMSVYLDRFLNVPPAAIPEPKASGPADEVLAELPSLLDRQQQVNETGERIARYCLSGGDPGRLRSLLGRLLLREDRDFHTIQTVEAAFRQSLLDPGSLAATHYLIAAGRYLAAHAPTVRAQDQTYQIALRLHRGERIYEGD